MRSYTYMIHIIENAYYIIIDRRLGLEVFLSIGGV